MLLLWETIMTIMFGWRIWLQWESSEKSTLIGKNKRVAVLALWHENMPDNQFEKYKFFNKAIHCVKASGKVKTSWKKKIAVLFLWWNFKLTIIIWQRLFCAPIKRKFRMRREGKTSLRQNGSGWVQWLWKVFFFLPNVGTSEAEATSVQALTIERRPRGAEPQQLKQAGHGGRESEGKEKHEDVRRKKQNHVP